MRTRRLGLLPVIVLAATGLLVPHAAAASPEFPPGDTGFHTYNEMAAEVAATAAAHPAIVRRFSIGTSYQGRQLWAVKVSNNVGVD